MKYRSLFFKRLLPVALALGTAWAARGQIGHEYGAAWAGSIGVLTVLALSGRHDWLSRLPSIVALGAIAWGIGGIMSYGKVVGYGHAGDYLNVSYGLLMLLLIGGLYGFIGGGITGLLLETNSLKRVNIATLITEMVAGGFLFWGFLIYQLEWYMTPPRSELWAGCLGAAFALGWYMYRNGYEHALRTAFFSALGAGFGFAFGNFLQRMGHTSGIKFNWWNVMEYSIGFFGGMGLAYGVFSDKSWPESPKPDKSSNIAGWIFLIVLLPAVNLIEGMNTKTMIDTGTGMHMADAASFALIWQLVAWIFSILIMSVLTFYFRPGLADSTTHKKAMVLTLVSLIWYILISNFISATWLRPVFSSQHLYWINFLVLFFMMRKNNSFPRYSMEEFSAGPATKKLIILWSIAILIVLVISYVAVSVGDKNPNAQLRF